MTCNFARKFRHNKKALSPAIAIALLLAITIALVAAVGYSTTMVTPTVSQTDQAVFDVKILKTGGAMANGEIKIKELSGSAIATSDLELRFIANNVVTDVVPTGNNTLYMNWYLFNPVDTGYSGGHLNHNDAGTKEVDDGITCIGVHMTDAQDPPMNWIVPVTVELHNSTSSAWQTASLSSTNPLVHYTDCWHNVEAVFANYTIANPDDTVFDSVRITTSSDVSVTLSIDDNTDMGPVSSGDAAYIRLSEYNSPFLYKVSTIPTRNMEVSFGNFAMTAGDTMKSIGSYGCSALISNWADISYGDTVQVYILYTPSNQVIWQGDVVVQ